MKQCPGPFAGCRHAAGERRQLVDLTDMRKNGLGISARLVRGAQIFVILFDPAQADRGQNVRRHSGWAWRDSGGTSELDCVARHRVGIATIRVQWTDLQPRKSLQLLRLSIEISDKLKLPAYGIRKMLDTCGQSAPGVRGWGLHANAVPCRAVPRAGILERNP